VENNRITILELGGFIFADFWMYNTFSFPTDDYDERKKNG